VKAGSKIIPGRSPRVILCFFAAQDDRLRSAAAALRPFGKPCVFRGAQSVSRRTLCSKYSALKLEHEFLIAAGVSSADVIPAVKALRAAGESSIFVLPSDLPTGCAPPPALPAEPGPGFARRCAENRVHPGPAPDHWRIRLREIDMRISAAHADLLQSVALGHATTNAATWFIDNMYLVRTHLAEAARDLPRRRQLPIDPRIYELARELVRNSGFCLSEANIREALREYQTVACLRVAELWMFPAFLRLAVIEELTALAETVSTDQHYRELGFLWADRLGASSRVSAQALQSMQALMASQPYAGEPYFRASLAEQLQGEEDALAAAQVWIEHRGGEPLSAVIRAAHVRETTLSVAAGQAFGSLRTLSRLDFKGIFESVNAIDAELSRDPAAIYARCDFETRNLCRREVERIAMSSGMPEPEVARLAVALASEAQEPVRRHVGYFLLSGGVLDLERRAGARPDLRTRIHRLLHRHATLFYIGGTWLLTACLLAIALRVANAAGVHNPFVLGLLGLLSLFPLSELSIQIVNALVISMFAPVPLPKMDFTEGIPPEHATLVVIPMLLASHEVVKQQIDKLEVRYLANREQNLYFSLFSDFVDAPDITAPSDAPLLEAARAGIARLNRQYGEGRFLLFHRMREWSETEQRWIGRERKRGKIEELNAYLTGRGSRDILDTGQLNASIRYVITLDSDTLLPPGTARRLIETIAHPLNRARLDPVTHVCKAGYSIIQPRVSIALPGAIATRFTRLFANTLGTDTYSLPVSDAQQDLFGEGIFHGKAIYDVHSFQQALAGRFPPETLLSHDLIEGSFAGTGFASDIELLENLPIDYAAYVRRQHRWIRGDWQIAPWILPKVPAADGSRVPNVLSAIARWRILDNLRRSLVAPASLLLLILGWLISPAPGVWSLVVVMAIAIPGLAPLLDRLARQIQRASAGWHGAADEIKRAAVMVVFLPHQAFLSVDAIARACYRSWISRRRLLEWQTSEIADAKAEHYGRTVRGELAAISALSTILLIIVGLQGKIPSTAALLALWIGSPLLLRWLNSPAPRPKRRLSPRDILYLRRIARRTWRYFDDLVGPESNWLPPDNSQLALRVGVAHRTSPTNIGLWLASAFAAHDFGYITAEELCRRCSHTLDTLEQREKYEGHLLNWYNTQTLEPDLPKYVSTVDSGNLLASLWTVHRGCEELIREPVIGASALRGLGDTLALLMEASGADFFLSTHLNAARRLLRGTFEGHHLVVRLRLVSHFIQHLLDVRKWEESSPHDEHAYWAIRCVRECETHETVLDGYLRWMEVLSRPPDSFLTAIGEETVLLRRRGLQTIPSLHDLAEERLPIHGILDFRGKPDMRPDQAAWLEQLALEFEQARRRARDTIRDLRAAAARALALADGMNMRFLYDDKQRLFGIGYLVGGPVEFTSHYDLLASESRLASFVSLAKGDVSLKHWAALYRPRVGTGRHQALLSWSGTMFEYLMPLLFTKNYPNSLLDQACREAVFRQMRYAAEKQVPWGISECGYSALDANQLYQYRAFGVPSLALHQEPDEEPVISPYSTALALMVDSHAAVENLRKLQDLGLLGPMGFYEAIDFSRESKPGGQRGVIVYSYMAHHQGMSLLALDNALNHGATQRRFHGDPRVRAYESLLYEQIPVSRLNLPEMRPRSFAAPERARQEPPERVWTEDTVIPRVSLYGNGRYSAMVTNAGGGYSRWRNFDITRWRSDTTLDCWGTLVFIRDLRAGAVWTATPHPLPGTRRESRTLFTADRAEFHRNVLGVETTLTVAVANDDDAELRRLVISNHSRRPRQLEFTSYVELAMAAHAADAAHPAFNKLFIETEQPGRGILIARRRPRSPEEPPLWCAHVLVGAPGSIQYETDRRSFIGRANAPRSAQALYGDLSGTTGAVLDPIFSLRCRLNMQPRERMEITFMTMAAESREALFAMIAKYQRRENIVRALEAAWTHSQLEFRYLRIGPSTAHGYQELASHLLFPNPRFRPFAIRPAPSTMGQSGLWAVGISGDLPIITAAIQDSTGLPLARDLLLAHSYWRLRGFQADLILLNQETPGYDRPLHTQLQRLIDAHAGESGAERPGGVFLRDWHLLSEDQRNLVLAASRVVLSGSRGSLERQISITPEAPPSNIIVHHGAAPAEEPSPPLPFLELPYFNGIGGFTRDGREYAIYLGPGTVTPAPWVNVIANSGFGTLVSESGLGFTWRGNSQQNRLTPWHNDPVSDPQSEVIYLRDEESSVVWTPTAAPIREIDAHRARHGQGYTVYEHNSHAIEQELTVFVPVDSDGGGDPVKICRLRLRNVSHRRRHLTATYFAEWVLGVNREDQQAHVQTEFDEPSGALLAMQSWTGVHPERIAFAAASPRAVSYSGDRRFFLGRNRSHANPAAMERVTLHDRTGPAMDPAAALRVGVDLDPGEQTEVIFLLGEADSLAQVRAIAGKYQDPGRVAQALDSVRKFWDQRLGVLQVHTPQLSTDFLLNRWLLYQALSCRFWGRSALYQSSGAYGFRDQLQDSLALLYCAPELVRQHILRAASRQFPEGDVQHWWHEETGLGSRTRCADDLLWLPFAVARYVEVTGDEQVLDAMVPFLEGPPLEPGQQESVFAAAVSTQTANLWEHCRRALEHAWRLGPHGLPLFGAGDWNDGLNRVGIGGRGESTWMAWFLATILNSMAKLARRRDPGFARLCEERAAALAEAMEISGWDGEWYLRGFFDDGSPLGSRGNAEAKIDSLPQSWAVLSRAADPTRARRAMESAHQFLVRETERLVLLFTPPFNSTEPSPGYIQGYPPGIRENGGQYTHASLWLAMAWARLGEGGKAVELLTLMNPVERARDPKSAERFRVEPYVCPADVYSAPGREGQGGWTWYSGSAAWMYRVWIEEVLGFQLRGEWLSIRPVLPPEWPGVEMSYRYRSATYAITVEQRAEAPAFSLTLDGTEVESGWVRLSDDGAVHHIRVQLKPSQQGTMREAGSEPRTEPAFER
jgi:cyclic beta-1,2-glucan synthetase